MEMTQSKHEKESFAKRDSNAIKVANLTAPGAGPPKKKEDGEEVDEDEHEYMFKMH